MAGIRACHIRDGAALTAFLCWLERTVASGAEKVTEKCGVEDHLIDRVVLHSPPSLFNV